MYSVHQTNVQYTVSNVIYCKEYIVRSAIAVQPLSVFLCDKRELERTHGRKRAETLLAALRREPTLLERFRHSNVLALTNRLEENAYAS